MPDARVPVNDTSERSARPVDLRPRAARAGERRRALMRRVTGLVLALDADDPAVAKLIDDLRRRRALAREASPPPTSHRGWGPMHRPTQRPYVDHSRDIGAYNPCFPEYDIAVDGARATGTVTFPVVFEGPPGDRARRRARRPSSTASMQHHNCDVGVAGKTTSMLVEYRRPTPLGVRAARSRSTARPTSVASPRRPSCS